MCILGVPANGVFVQLYPVWRNLNMSKDIKIRIKINIIIGLWKLENYQPDNKKTTNICK